MQPQNLPVYISYGKQNFQYMYNIYKKFLGTVPFNKLKTQKTGNKDAGIIVAPRNNSGIPFCNLTIALLYLHAGRPVKIIWDDLMFLDDEMQRQNHLLSEIIDFICQQTGIKYFQLSKMKEEEINEEEERQIRRLAIANSIWNVRKVVPSPELDRYTVASYDVLKNNAKKINYFYGTHEFDHCIHQSLINENGGLHKMFANKYNIRIGSLDLAAGKGQMSTDDVPGYHGDLVKIVKDSIFKDDANRKLAIKDAEKEFKSRMYVKDKKGIQTVSFSRDQNNYNAEIIIPLNILWDGPALGRNRLFATPFEWLDQTISFILNETNSVVAVRQHPNERNYSKYGTGDDVGRYLNEKYGRNSQFVFISCYDNVNTYLLVRNAKIVLPYTSSVGLEAALMGKKVIVESDVYYSDLSIVTKSQSKQEYFNEIKRVANGHGLFDNCPNSTKHDAWLLYFLVNECPRIYTDFGLEPKDFSKWANNKFEALLNDEDLTLAIKGLASGVSYAYMNCKRILKKNRKRIDREFELPVEAEEETRESIEKVAQLINKNNYNLALEFIDNQSSSVEEIFLYPKAYALAKLGRVNESNTILDELIALKPNNYMAICLQVEIENRHRQIRVGKEQKKSQKQVIGIISPSYSGSTLLTAILGAHSKIFGAGEVRWLVEKEYFDVKKMIKNTSNLSKQEETPWKNVAFNNVTFNDVYQTIFRIFDKNCIVDSSKDIGYFTKIVAHNKGNDISFTFIFLTKHPLRLISSHLMHRWDKWEKLKNYNRIDAINYLINDVYHKLMKSHSNLNNLKKEHQIITVKYEDIVEDTRSLMKGLLKEINLSYEEKMENYYEKEQFIFGGNAGPRYHIAKAQTGIEKDIPNPIQNEFYKRNQGISMDNNFRKVFSEEEIKFIYQNDKINILLAKLGYQKIY